MAEKPRNARNPGNVFPTQNRCEICGAAFTTGALLRDHVRLHAAQNETQRASIEDQQSERKP